MNVYAEHALEQVHESYSCFMYKLHCVTRVYVRLHDLKVFKIAFGYRSSCESPVLVHWRYISSYCTRVVKQDSLSFRVVYA